MPQPQPDGQPRVEMSPNLRATLQRAVGYARQQGHRTITIEHVLLALNEDPDASLMLEACGIDQAQLHADISGYLGHNEDRFAPGETSEPVMDPEAARIINSAVAAAQKSRRTVVNAAIVLAAIIGDGRSAAANTLRAQGLTFEGAIKALQLGTQANSPPQPPGPSAQQYQPRPHLEPQPEPNAHVPVEEPPRAAPPEPEQDGSRLGSTDEILADARRRVEQASRPARTSERHPAQPPISQPNAEMPDAEAAPAERPAPVAQEPQATPAGPTCPVAPPEQVIAPPEQAMAPPVADSVAQPEPVAARDPEQSPHQPADPARRLQTRLREQRAESPEGRGPFDPGLVPAPRPGTQAPGPQPDPDHRTRSAEPVAPSQESPPAPVGQRSLGPFSIEGDGPPNRTKEDQPPRQPSRQDMPSHGTRHQPDWAPHPARQPARPSPHQGHPPAADVERQRPQAPHQPTRQHQLEANPTGYRPPAHQSQHPAGQSHAPAPAHATAPPHGAPAQPYRQPPGHAQPSAPPFRPEDLRQPSQHPHQQRPHAPLAEPPQTQARAPQQSRPQGQLPPSSEYDRAARVQREQAERPGLRPGQLHENIPRRMRAWVPVRVEVRLARAEISNVGQGMAGAAPSVRHDIKVTKAMSVRLRAPEGGFYIETGSPETQWVENQHGVMTDDFASWRWTVTPTRRGNARLQLIVSARTVGSDGLVAETALPDQVIDVSVSINYARLVKTWGGWAAAAIAGGLLAKFGEDVFAIVRALVG